MTRDEMLAIKAKVEATPHLFSARHTKDYEAMANVLNEERDDGVKLTALDLHTCMDAE